MLPTASPGNVSYGSLLSRVKQLIVRYFAECCRCLLSGRTMSVMTSVPVRWRFFSVIFLLSFVSYLMRQNIHVAGEFMMPELH